MALLTALFTMMPQPAAAAGLPLNHAAVVVNTNGANVHYREGASLDYPVKGTLAEGDSVWVIEGPANGWYRVYVGSTVGWIDGRYLAASSGAAAKAAPAQSSGSGVVLNHAAVVVNTGGGGVHYREGAGLGYNVKGTLAQGDTVQVVEGPANGWYRVYVGSTVGWIDGRYLAASSGAAAKAAPAAPAGLTGYVKVANTGGDAVRVRSTPYGKIVATAGTGTVMQVKQGPVSNGGMQWYQVAGSNITGWMTADYLVKTSAPVKAATKSAPQQVVPARTGASRGTAASIAGGVVGVAMRYVGYSYVFGGTSPAGFDCSGFVYYVFNKAGIRIGRSMDSEINSGSRISSKDLQPGDLVFFANTYRAGISHVAIYMGNGKIVHAADYSTGVEISNLWSAYWAAHYAFAVRVGR